MPPEVLYNIYDWLRLIEQDAFVEGYRKRSDPFPFTYAFNSKALLPYTQAYRYHHTSITSVKNFVGFARHVQRTPAVGPYVRLLRLSSPPVPGSDATASTLTIAQRGSLVTAWPCLHQLRTLILEGMEDAVTSFMAAAEGGLKLPMLKTLAIVSAFGDGTSAWDPAKWAKALEAAPRLEVLDIHLVQDEAMDGPVNIPAAPVGSTAPLATRLRSLTLSGFPASHALAVANLANAFPSVAYLRLYADTVIDQPRIVQALCLPALRSLDYEWLVEHEMQCEPLRQLDVRHLARLEEFVLSCSVCAPELRLQLPPSTRLIKCPLPSMIPLAALTELVQPGPLKLPNLAQITLDLPFGNRTPFPTGHTADEMAEWKLEEQYYDLPQWTEEVSRAGLTRLLRVARRHGVEVAGTATAAFDFEKAVWRRVEAGHSLDLWGQDDLDEIYMYWDEEGYLDDEMDSEDEGDGEW